MREMTDLQIDVVVASSRELDAVKALWLEYWNSLGLPPEFQGFERERQSLPGAYSPPKGRLLLARIDSEPAGSIALRPLSERSCEAKRLYVRPLCRGRGVARALLAELVREARAGGYTEMFADTLESMKPALRLYTQIGFSEVPAYSANPTPGAIFLKLRL
jgi:carbonic anhydrase